MIDYTKPIEVVNEIYSTVFDATLVHTLKTPASFKHIVVWKPLGGPECCDFFDDEGSGSGARGVNLRNRKTTVTRWIAVFREPRPASLGGGYYTSCCLHETEAEARKPGGPEGAPVAVLPLTWEE